MDRVELTQHIRDRATELGFARVGVCRADAAPGFARFEQWLESHFDGEMRYLRARRDKYERPQSVLENARSIVMLAMNYRTSDPEQVQPGEGRVARYAWGTLDYHDFIHDRLHALADFVRSHCPASSVRGIVDTAPLLEREFAQMAGLGWAGKNTLLIHPQAGSYFFLAAILTDQELEYDPPFATEHCGTCRACLDACPTQAFPAPFVMDARRCISYLTIELRGPIPLEMREGIGDWLFGCDICQEVCPWNSKAPISTINAFEPRSDLWSVELSELFFLTEDQFRARFRTTPLWRSKRQGILRNAAIVLGNQRAANAVRALRVGLVDSDPVIREACAWALSRLRLTEASLALREQHAIEAVDWVRDRIADYLTSVPPHDS